MITYTEGYKYQLALDAEFQINVFPYKDIVTDYICLDRGGRLKIKKGYAWDGASGPTIDTRNSMQASLVHDALYQLIRLELLPMTCRSKADKELFRIGYNDGMFEWRIRTWLWAVNRFARGAALPSSQKALLYAP